MHDTFEFNLLDFQTNDQKMDANNAWDLAWRFLLVWLRFSETKTAGDLAKMPPLPPQLLLEHFKPYNAGHDERRRK